MVSLADSITRVLSCRSDVRQQDRPCEAVISPTLAPPPPPPPTTLPAGSACHLGEHPHESVEFLVESVLCLVAAGKKVGGAYALMTVTRWEGLSGKQSFINCSLTGVGRSGSCLQSEVLMASPTPCILSSSFAFPIQKNVYPFGYNKTFLGEPGLAEAGNVDLVSTKFPRDECGFPFGPRRGIPVQEGEHIS